MLAAAAVWFELALLIACGLALFMHWGYTVAEAGIYAVIAVLMTLSFVLQVFFWAGIAEWSIIFEAILVLAAGCTLFRRRALLEGVWHRILRSSRGRFPLLGLSALCVGYLACQCFLVPPTVTHWPELARILWYPKTTLLDLPEPIRAQLYVQPLNISILSYLFLRVPTDYGLAGLGALGYVAIACGTYALSRRHAWPQTAVTVTLVVASLPRLVLQGSTPGLEIIPAAVSLFGILCIYRLIEESSVRDFVLLWLGMLFNASSGRFGLSMTAILCIVAAILLLRRHAAVFWWGLTRRSWRSVLAAAFPALVFSQAWLFASRRTVIGSWFDAAGSGEFLYNRDGLPGALDNAVRYLLESIDLTAMVACASRWAFGFSPAQSIENVYHAFTTLLPADRDAAYPFSVAWIPNEMLSWFGPLAVVLIVPAVLYASWRGTRRLKVIGIALIGYFYLAVLIPAWVPGNAALFTPWFVCGGYLVGFLLPPWRISQKGLAVLRFICILLIGHALLLNVSKPAVGNRFFQAEKHTNPAMESAAGPLSFPDRIENSIWLESAWGKDRWLRARRLFGDDRVERCSALLEPNARVGMAVKTPGLSYPFLVARPDVEFEWIDIDTCSDMGRFKLPHLKYVLFVDMAPDASPWGFASNTIWEADPAAARFPGGLIQVGR